MVLLLHCFPLQIVCPRDDIAIMRANSSATGRVLAPARGRAGRGWGTPWLSGRAVGRGVVQRGQRGNGSAFGSLRPLSPLRPHPSLLSTAAWSFFPPSIFLSRSSRGGGEEVFSHGLLPNCFSVTLLRYFFVRKIFGHIFSLIGSFSGACAATVAPSCKRKRKDRDPGPQSVTFHFFF